MPVAPHLFQPDGEQLLGQFIPLHYHWQMLQDERRVAAFQQAIDQVVAPGATVLELGGGTGILSFFAAKKASRVWCVEQNPELITASRQFLQQNQVDSRVEVVEADAFTYLPPTPVDVVICEMLHVGLLREKQTEVLQSFQSRYRTRFGPRLPRFVPEASLLAVQPVEQSFMYSGFVAEVPTFQTPAASDPRTCSLGEVQVYTAVDYAQKLPEDISWTGEIPITADGTCNALRFLTRNLLSIDEETGEAVDWWNQFLVLPLAQPCAVSAGDQLRVEFAYRPGGSLESLANSLRVSVSVAAIRRNHAA